MHSSITWWHTIEDNVSTTYRKAKVNGEVKVCKDVMDEEVDSLYKKIPIGVGKTSERKEYHWMQMGVN